MMKKELDFTDAQMMRMHAEELLKEKEARKEIPTKETDVAKLMHELQVHQIELEMQNDELRQAYETAETALKKFTMLYDLAPMGYFTLDADGQISELNFTGADMLGAKRFSLINSNFKLFVSEDSKLVFSKFLSEIYNETGKISCEVTIGQDKNNLCPVYIEGIVTGDDRDCLLSAINISDFKK